jgi:hypothetical protein
MVQEIHRILDDTVANIAVITRCFGSRSVLLNNIRFPDFGLKINLVFTHLEQLSFRGRNHGLLGIEEKAKKGQKRTSKEERRKEEEKKASEERLL